MIQHRMRVFDSALTNCLSSDSEKRPFLSFFVKLWKQLVAELKYSNEPMVWQTTDRWGITWWHVYNPAIGHSATRESGVEILEWIDNHLLDE